MNMIFLNAYLTNPPAVYSTGFVEKLAEAAGYFASQNPFPILWDPYQMILKSMLGMSPRSIPGHRQIMPDWPPLRQLKLAPFRVPFIPRLKSLGFSGLFWPFI
jgi:hypothetical protein